MNLILEQEDFEVYDFTGFRPTSAAAGVPATSSTPSVLFPTEVEPTLPMTTEVPFLPEIDDYEEGDDVEELLPDLDLDAEDASEAIFDDDSVDSVQENTDPGLVVLPNPSIQPPPSTAKTTLPTANFFPEATVMTTLETRPPRPSSSRLPARPQMAATGTPGFFVPSPQIPSSNPSLMPNPPQTTTFLSPPTASVVTATQDMFPTYGSIPAEVENNWVTLGQVKIIQIMR